MLESEFQPGDLANVPRPMSLSQPTAQDCPSPAAFASKAAAPIAGSKRAIRMALAGSTCVDFSAIGQVPSYNTDNAAM